jgi:hypothetical protein
MDKSDEIEGEEQGKLNGEDQEAELAGYLAMNCSRLRPPLAVSAFTTW